jgi:tetratricopeptide (TPR) repeat protein
MGRAEEAVKQTEQGLNEDPLNVMARIGFAISLISMGRLAKAQAEAHKVLELDENDTSASVVLAITYARQQKWTEALHFTEKCPPMPFTNGILAGVLKRMGKVNRAEELIQKLMPGEAYGVPFGLYSFYFLCGDIDRAADWLEKAIEQRHPKATYTASIYFRSTSRWSGLARLLNLPEEAR